MGVEQQAIRAQVERLLQSKTFETSEAHRRLLQYLAEETLAGKADRLKEYTIGLEAFGKPASYDPRQDSIVRLQVSRLRQKLMAYYETEGSEDPVHISLPKGGFKLSFDPGPKRRGGWIALSAHHGRIIVALTVAFVLTAAWAVYATVNLVRLRRQMAPVAERWTPELAELWAPFLESRRPMLVCLGAPLFVRIPSLGFFRDPKANDWEEAMRSERMATVRRVLKDSQWLASYNFTGVGEASGAFLLAQVLSPHKRDLLITRSNLLNWQEIVDNDIVFVGPPKFNLQLKGEPLAQEIVIEADGVRNLKPQRGEPEFLTDHFLPGKPNEGETHAVISRMPGLSGVGEFLAISGNASADTLAAAQWLTQPWRASELVKWLAGDSGHLPRYYQVVLKVAFKYGVPVQSSYVFHHVLYKAPAPAPRAN